MRNFKRLRAIAFATHPRDDRKALAEDMRNIAADFHNAISGFSKTFCAKDPKGHGRKFKRPVPSFNMHSRSR